MTVSCRLLIALGTWLTNCESAELVSILEFRKRSRGALVTSRDEHEHGDLKGYGRFATLGDMPAETEESGKMSKDLQGRGFRFVGPTICYAYMQGAGLVNDHTTDCFRHSELADRR